MRHDPRPGSVFAGATCIALACALAVCVVGEAARADIPLPLSKPTTLPTTRPLRRKPPPAPVVTQPATPVPGVAAQQTAAVRIRAIYAADYIDTSYPARRVLARKLIEQGDATQRDTDAKFALYREARDVAADAGDVPTAFDAINHMAGAFPVIRLHQRVEVLSTAVPLLNSPQSNAAIVAMCLDLVDQCVVENDFERAQLLLNLAATAAPKCEKRAYVSWVQWRQNQMIASRLAYEQARPAETRLKRWPDDAPANLAMGRYVCLVRRDWDAGLLMLVKGSDQLLSELAERDLQCPDDRVLDQFQLAEAWWSYAEKQDDEARPGYRHRAAYWYRRTLPLLDGLDKATAERRIAEASPKTTTLNRIPRPPDAMPYNGHFYRVNIAEVTWEMARRICEDAGGHLVSLENRLENDYVIKLARDRTVWLGASLDAKNRWRWITDADMFFSYWSHGQPDLTDPQSRPQMSDGGAWKTSTDRAGFVCEWDN